MRFCAWKVAERCERRRRVMGGRVRRGNTRDGRQKRVWGRRCDGGSWRQSEGAPEEREPQEGKPLVPQEVTVNRERTVRERIVNREGTPLGLQEPKPEPPQAQILKSPIYSGHI